MVWGGVGRCEWCEWCGEVWVVWDGVGWCGVVWGGVGVRSGCKARLSYRNWCHVTSGVVWVVG